MLVRALTQFQESGRLALGSRFTIHDARRTWRTCAGELRVPFEVDADRNADDEGVGMAITKVFAIHVGSRSADGEARSYEFSL